MAQQKYGIDPQKVISGNLGKNGSYTYDPPKKSGVGSIVGGAIVGGVVAGPVGAIVGALAGKSSHDSKEK